MFTTYATFNFILHVKYVLYFYISTFRSMCVVPYTAVFCSSLTSWCPYILLRYCLSDFEMVPVAPIITGITFDFTTTTTTTTTTTNNNNNNNKFRNKWNQYFCWLSIVRPVPVAARPKA